MITNSLINREEIRRLQKAAKDNDKSKLREWADNFEKYLISIHHRYYIERYSNDINLSINNFIIALVYALKYSEEVEIKDENIGEFISDLMATVDMYRLCEKKPDDYIDELELLGITVEHYDYQKIYKEKLEELDNLIDLYQKQIEEYDKNTAETNENKK